jgi:outer membrane lipoprotein-sorting protein
MEMKATTILRKMRARYNELHSYQDAGIITTGFNLAEAVFTTRFQTFFKKPSFLRLHWESHGTTYLILCDGRQVYSKFDSRDTLAVIGEVTDAKILTKELFRSGGISDWVTQVIPGLLFQNQGLVNIANPPNISSEKESSVNGEACYKLKTISEGAQSLFQEYLFVSKSGLLLKRYERIPLVQQSYPTVKSFVFSSVRIDEVLPDDFFRPGLTCSL